VGAAAVAGADAVADGLGEVVGAGEVEFEVAEVKVGDDEDCANGPPPLAAAAAGVFAMMAFVADVHSIGLCYWLWGFFMSKLASLPRRALYGVRQN